MKKMLLPVALCSVFFFSSCEKEGLRQDIDVDAELSTQLEQLIASYEESLDGTNDFTLKGYQRLDAKDETTPTQEIETTASSDIIDYLKAKVDLDKASGYSKTARMDYPKPYPTDYMVGVFKTTTCGNSPEFIYLMDCEDGGWTNISNPNKEAFATIADRNGNIEFHMCVVRGANFGGFALALGPIYDMMDNLNIIERFHDNEDHSPANSVISSVKPNAQGYIGPSNFSANTMLSWVADFSTRQNRLPFSYGVINESGKIEIGIDDENGSNANWARHFVVTRIPGMNETGQWETWPHYKEWYGGFNLWENTGYRISIR